jgi:hypothetical protein
MSRITEAEIAVAVLQILATRPNGEANFAVLKHEIPNHVTLSADDQARSVTRPNEEMWEQQVRNITSHHESPGNIICEGYAERIDGGLRITAAGRLHIAAAA